MKSTLLAIGILLSLPAAAGEGRWSDGARPHARPAREKAHGIATPVGSGLRVYASLDEFEAALGDPGGLAYESFDNGLAQAGDVLLCQEPINDISDDLCFAPNDLVPGFAVRSTSGSGVVAIGSGVLGAGQSTSVVGATEFADSTVLAFPTPVDAFSMDIYEGVNASEVTVEVFDGSGASLGTTSVTPASADSPVFLGIVSDVPIAHVELTATGDGGELIDNLRFGDAVPTGNGDALFVDGFDVVPNSPTAVPAFEPAVISAGTISTLTISLSNDNPTPAVLLDDLVAAFPAGLIVANPSNAGTTCLDASVDADAGSVTLAAGARILQHGSCEITIDVTSDAEDVYTITIAAGALTTNVGDSEVDVSADLAVIDASCSPQQLLADPGIEATDTSDPPYVNAFWNSTSTNFGTVFCDFAGCGDGLSTAAPHTGTYWAWFGGANGQPETATLEQEVVIAAGSSRFLNFWLWIGAIGDGSSSLDVAIDGANVATFDEPSDAEIGYTQRSADVSGYADGNAHTVTFTYTAPAAASNYSVDDITLECVAAPSMPSVPAAITHASSEATQRKH